MSETPNPPAPPTIAELEARLAQSEKNVQILAEQNNAMQTIINTILIRANGTIVLLAKHRKAYLELCQKLNRAPLIDIVPRKGSDDLYIHLVTDPHKLGIGPSGVDLETLSGLLTQARIVVTDDLLVECDRTPDRLASTVQWATQEIASFADGAEPNPMPRPSWLPPAPNDGEITAAQAAACVTGALAEKSQQPPPVADETSAPALTVLPDPVPETSAEAVPAPAE